MARMKMWVSVLIAVAIVAGVWMIAAVGGSVYWVSRHVQAQSASSTTAADELSRTRARFAGQKPLVEIRERDDAVVRRDERRTDRRVELTSLHAIAFDPDEGKILRVNIPIWVLRLARGPLRIRRIGLDSNVRLTLDDLEASGPGLVVDGRSPDGQQFIVWTE